MTPETIATNLIMELQQNFADNAGCIDYDRYEKTLLNQLKEIFKDMSNDKTAAKDEWMHYTQIDFTDEKFNYFSIDTRDFHCNACFTELPKLDLHCTAKNPDKVYFTVDELKKLLDRYFTESGGNAKWRMFSLEGYCRGWEMKYLRIIRLKKGFVVCTNFREVYTVHKKKNLQLPVERKHLGAY